jgi:hypothetical protein
VPKIPLVLLVVFAAVLLWFLYSDGREYRRFKALTETRDRQRTYALWFVKSFLAFGAGAVASLALLGDLPSLVRLPLAFAPLLQPLRASLSEGNGIEDFLFGFAFAIIVGVVAVSIILHLRGKRGGAKPNRSLWVTFNRYYRAMLRNVGGLSSCH